MMITIVAVLVTLGIMYYADHNWKFNLFTNAMLFAMGAVVVYFVVKTILAFV